MKLIRDIETIDLTHLPKPRKQDWTAIIRAAGRGTRLGNAQPKILFPILGKPILEWLIKSLDPFVDRFVFVLSPEGHPQVESVLKSLLKGRYDVAVQPVPNGMADAVRQAKPFVRTRQSIVLWGDH